MRRITFNEIVRTTMRNRRWREIDTEASDTLIFENAAGARAVIRASDGELEMNTTREMALALMQARIEGAIEAATHG